MPTDAAAVSLGCGGTLFFWGGNKWWLLQRLKTGQVLENKWLFVAKCSHALL